jgi:hypothetical protein
VRRLRTLAVLAVLATVLAAPPPGTAAADGAASFTFAPCNRTYQQRGAELAPVTQGGVNIEVRSPENRLDLLSHRLDLTPLGDGTHRAHFVAEFAGSGELIADVGVAGMTSRLEDSVTVPRQERIVVGRVRLGRGEQGYEITPVELPDAVDVRIESRLAGRFAALCESFALLPGMLLDCGALRAGLSRARVPMPESGETYLLPAECLDAGLRQRLDAYLGLPPAGAS